MGYPIKIWDINENMGFSNENMEESNKNLGVSNETSMGSPMKGGLP